MPYNPDDLMVQCDECKDWYIDSSHLCCVSDHFVVGASFMFVISL